MTKDELQADYLAEIADAMERLKASLTLATSGLQYLTLVNGGALIALFTLIGTGKVKFDMDGMWSAFACFAGGIALSLAAYMLGYLAQNQFYFVAYHRAWNAQAEMAGRSARHDPAKPLKAGNRFLYGAISSAAIALVCFIAGAAVTLASVT